MPMPDNIRTVRHKAEIKDDGVHCFGCGGEFPEGAYGGMRNHEVVLSPEHCVHVCMTSRGPLKTCVRKAREKASVCPGCGNAGIEPGDICEACYEAIDAAKKVPELKDLRRIGIDPRAVFGSFSSADAPAAEEALELTRLLARAVTGPGGEYAPRGNGAGLAFSIADRYSHNPDSDWPVAYMTRPQIDALREFTTRLARVADLNRKVGKAEGHRILVRLAQGDLSLKEFEQLEDKARAQEAQAIEDEE